MMLSEIIDVKPLRDFKLQIFLDNGSSALLALKRKTRTARFGILLDSDVWNSVSTNGLGIHWGEYLSITLSEALEILAEI